MISALNAYLLKHLVHCPDPCSILHTAQVPCAAPRPQLPQVKSRRVHALALAIADILWHCGGNTHAVVALPLNYSPSQVLCGPPGGVRAPGGGEEGV